MDNLEGMLMVPPERGPILGKAVWKVSFLHRSVHLLHSRAFY
jgi:hypothetical protein